MSVAESVVNMLLMVLRTCVGSAMIYSGVQLVRGEGLLSGSEFDSIMTGIFVILLGFNCVFLAFFKKLTDTTEHR